MFFFTGVFFYRRACGTLCKKVGGAQAHVHGGGAHGAATL